jgi:hypothetical protein
LQVKKGFSWETSSEIQNNTAYLVISRASTHASSSSRRSNQSDSQARADIYHATLRSRTEGWFFDQPAKIFGSILILYSTVTSDTHYLRHLGFLGSLQHLNLKGKLEVTDPSSRKIGNEWQVSYFHHPPPFPLPPSPQTTPPPPLPNDSMGPIKGRGPLCRL